VRYFLVLILTHPFDQSAEHHVSLEVPNLEVCHEIKKLTTRSTQILVRLPSGNSNQYVPWLVRKKCIVSKYGGIPIEAGS
jgi:hypothetical protein